MTKVTLRYKTLRDCFVGGRYFREGEIVEIPDGTDVYPKNFEPVEKPSIPADKIVVPTKEDETPVTTEPETLSAMGKETVNPKRAYHKINHRKKKE